MSIGGGIFWHGTENGWISSERTSCIDDGPEENLKLRAEDVKEMKSNRVQYWLEKNLIINSYIMKRSLPIGLTF